MKKLTLLKSMLLLCALVAGSGSVWADDLTTADLAWPSPQLSENFNGVATTSSTSKINSTSVTTFGLFNKLYNNQTYNTYAIASNATFGSNALSLSCGGGSAVIAGITNKSFATIGAFSFKVLKTCNCYVGLYASGTDTNATSKSQNAVYIYNNVGTISVAGLSGGSTVWNEVGSYTSDIIEICVIYNNTEVATTYGDGISLGAKTAHVFVNGTCKMDGATPKAFALPGKDTNTFRVVPKAVNGNTAIVDDVVIYDKLPVAEVGGTISASGWNTFSSPYALDLSTVTNGTAYVASAAGSSVVTLTPVDDKIVAAGTGLMIKGSPDADFTISTSTSAANFSGTNKLVGVPSGGKVEKNNHNYVFGWATGAPESPGFYLINDTEPVLAAGKSYLHADADLSARLFIDFGEGGVTAINKVEAAKQNAGEYYNLAGQRVAQPTKGLYIVNGKKVVIK